MKLATDSRRYRTWNIREHVTVAMIRNEEKTKATHFQWKSWNTWWRQWTEYRYFLSRRYTWFLPCIELRTPIHTSFTFFSFVVLLHTWIYIAHPTWFLPVLVYFMQIHLVQYTSWVLSPEISCINSCLETLHRISNTELFADSFTLFLSHIFLHGLTYIHSYADSLHNFILQIHFTVFPVHVTTRTLSQIHFTDSSHRFYTTNITKREERKRKEEPLIEKGTIYVVDFTCHFHQNHTTHTIIVAVHLSSTSVGRMTITRKEWRTIWKKIPLPYFLLAHLGSDTIPIYHCQWPYNQFTEAFRKIMSPSTKTRKRPSASITAGNRAYSE